MKRLSFLVLFFALPLLAFADNAESNAAAQVVQHFYNVYVKQLETGTTTARKYLLRSPDLTPAFKKAYMQLIHTPEMTYDDPIINAQDIPQGGFHVKYANVKGDSGIVLMTSADKAWTPLKVRVVKVNGAWQINGINKLKGQ